MPRVFHTADLHLDAPFSSLAREKRAGRRRGLRTCLSDMVQAALAGNIDVFAIVGDLFDSPRPSTDTFEFAIGELRRLREAGIECVIVPGNHDFYTPGGIWDHPAWGDTAHVFKENFWDRVVLADGGLEVHGVACHELNSEKDVLAELGQIKTSGRSIALLHGSRDRQYFRGERCYPFDAAGVDALPVDFLCLGHYHLPAALGKLGKAAYCGSPEGLDFTEPGAHSAAVVDIGSGGLTTTTVPTGRLVVQSERLDCTAFSSTIDIQNAIAARAGAERLLRVVLTGAPSAEVDFDTDELMAELTGDFFHLEVRDETVVTDFEHGDGATVRGRFLRRMRALAEQASEPEDIHIISVATRHGLAALQGRGGKR